MMNERLRLARQLLKEDGVIFVSIDDAEQAYLKILMDEIFGEENFVSNFHWMRNPGGQSDNKFVAKTYEFILTYTKNKETFKIKPLIKEQELLDFKYDEINNNFWRKTSRIEKSGSNDKLIDRPNMGYVVYYNKLTNKIILKHDYDKEQINNELTTNDKIYKLDNKLLKDNYIAILPRFIKGTYGCWRWSLKTFEDKFKQNKVMFFENKDGSLVPYEKELYVDFSPYKEILPKDLITFTTNQAGTNELYSITNNDLFNNPKPSGLIKFLVNLHPNKDARILDFFAGSGTTGHAVLELNKEDGGNRTFTLVTNNQNNIGINVNYERLFRINYGVGTKNEEFAWANKNEPYKSNLQVFNIKYKNINPFQNENNFLTKQFNEILNHFNIKENEKLNEESLLRSLSSLKTLSK